MSHKRSFGMCGRMPFFRSACGKCGFFFFFWRMPSKNVGWERIILQADELDGTSQLSCLTSALSTSSSLSSMIALVFVLNPLKVCKNMLVGGHLWRLPCKPAQSTQSSIVIVLRSRTRPKGIRKLEMYFHSQKPLLIRRPSFSFF